MNTKKLRQAIKAGDAAAVAELLKSGLDTEIRLTAGWTPLHIAVKAAKKSVVAALVNGGAEVNATTELYRTALDIRGRFTRESEKPLVERLSIQEEISQTACV